MGERSGPEPSEQGPKFGLDPLEAKALGLTNTEYMRQRWTGEMPPHVEELDSQTFSDQTRGKGKFWVAEEHQSEADQPNMDVLHFDQLDDYIAWAVPEAHELTLLMQQSLADPRAARPADILARASRWVESTRGFDYGRASYEPEVVEAIKPVNQLVADAFASTTLQLSAKADLADAAMTLAQLSKGRARLNEWVGDALLHTDVSVTASLLERDSPLGEVAMHSLEERFRDSRNLRYQREIGAKALPALARRVEKRTKRAGLLAADEELGLMTSIVQQIRHSDVTIKEAEMMGVDFQEVADATYKSFGERMAGFENGSDWMYHSAASELFDVLDRLYLPENNQPLKLPSNLPEFLRVVYRAKLEDYGYRSDIDEFRKHFNHLAEACGSPLRARSNR